MPHTHTHTHHIWTTPARKCRNTGTPPTTHPKTRKMSLGWLDVVNGANGMQKPQKQNMMSLYDRLLLNPICSGWLIFLLVSSGFGEFLQSVLTSCSFFLWSTVHFFATCQPPPPVPLACGRAVAPGPSPVEQKRCW